MLPLLELHEDLSISDLGARSFSSTSIDRPTTPSSSWTSECRIFEKSNVSLRVPKSMSIVLPWSVEERANATHRYPQV
jgi:hypothetical protein